jgi:predicted nucleotidyltransferase component of viral defense system
MNTSIQLKALIRNISKTKNINAQVLLRNYMFERFLERISKSKYSKNFILKGGLLIGAIVGVESRATMDIDATIKNCTVSEETIKVMIQEVSLIDLNDNVKFELSSIENIREESDYFGFRVSINSNFDGIRQKLKIDISTGDKITPDSIKYDFKLMFENRSIEILAYNLETILAEKIETILSRGIANTRLRDFYDVYILIKLQIENVDLTLLKLAIDETVKNRQSISTFNEKFVIFGEVISNNQLQKLWQQFQRKNDYAEDIDWLELTNKIKTFLEQLYE